MPSWYLEGAVGLGGGGGIITHDRFIRPWAPMHSNGRPLRPRAAVGEPVDGCTSPSSSPSGSSGSVYRTAEYEKKN